jgi:hypothetical protein
VKRTAHLLSLLVAVLALPSLGACKEDPAEDDGGTDTSPPDDFVPIPGGARRLVAHHYVESVRLMLGDAAADAAVPPRDGALFDFDAIGAKELAFEMITAEEYELSSRAISEATIADLGSLATLAPCVQAGDTSCYEEVAVNLGHMAYRRPLTEEEVTAITAIGEAGQQWAEGDFLEGLKYELMTILQSPHFLYFQEVGEEQDGESGRYLLTQPELVTRMSFFLNGRTPDLATLTRAEEGEFDDGDAIELLAREMVEHPDAKKAVANFYDELLHLRDLDTIGKDADLFPSFDESLAASMREETQRLIEDLVWETDGDFLTFFDADYTFVNDELADHYGVEAPGGSWGQVALGQGRAGWMTHSSFLARYAHPASNSPTKRGLFIQTKLLCNQIPPPPPGVDTTVPSFDPDAPLTLRDRLEAHQEDATCANCHGLMDPIGFAYEEFDPIGRWRELDNGLPIDASGDIQGVGAWTDAQEFAAVVAGHEDTPGCIVKNFIRGGLGYLEDDGQAAQVDGMAEEFMESGYSLQELMIELTVNPVFRLAGPAQ